MSSFNERLEAAQGRIQKPLEESGSPDHLDALYETLNRIYWDEIAESPDSDADHYLKVSQLREKLVKVVAQANACIDFIDRQRNG